MAALPRRQWSHLAAALALALPLLHLPSRVQAAGLECGPGYHKPLFGSCVPNPGVPLLRRSRYTDWHGTHHFAGRLPTPLRSFGPWGPRVRS